MTNSSAREPVIPIVYSFVSSSLALVVAVVAAVFVVVVVLLLLLLLNGDCSLRNSMDSELCVRTTCILWNVESPLSSLLLAVRINSTETPYFVILLLFFLRILTARTWSRLITSRVHALHQHQRFHRPAAANTIINNKTPAGTTHSGKGRPLARSLDLRVSSFRLLQDTPQAVDEYQIPTVKLSLGCTIQCPTKTVNLTGKPTKLWSTRPGTPK